MASRDCPGLTVPLSTTYGVAACFCAACILPRLAVPLVAPTSLASFFLATSSAAFLARFSRLFLLGWMPWNLHSRREVGQQGQGTHARED